MTKTRILVLHYSQSGQLTRAAKSFMAPLAARADVEVVWQDIQPKTPYPFPWGFFSFLDAFPESVSLDGPEIAPVRFDPDARFDLVVLAYQVWFLSPSLPIAGFLKSPAARVLRDTPVVTLIACRNMWLSAHEKMQQLLAAQGARLIDNVVLIDQGPAWATFVTTPRWLLTGKKDAFWFFPPAGVSAADIEGAGRFGRALGQALPRVKTGVSLLQGLGAVKVLPGYIAGERIAHRSFTIWGRLIRAVGKPGARARRAVLLVYLVFLIGMILTVLPLSMLLRALARPFIRARLARQVERLEQPSGSSTARIDEFLSDEPSRA